MQQLAIIFFLALAPFGGVNHAAAAEPNSTSIKDVEATFEYWLDPTGTDDPRLNAAASFRPIPDQHLNLGFIRDSAVWLRVRYDIQKPVAQRFYLALEKMSFRQIDYYHYLDGELIKQFLTGRDRPFQSRDLKMPHYNFMLSPNTGKHELLIRLTTRSPMQTNIKIAPAAGGVQSALKELNIYSGFVGFFTFLSIIAGGLIYATRRPEVIFALFVVLGALIEMLSSSGLGFAYLWPELPELNPFVARFGLGLALGATALFCVEFLKLKTFAPILTRTTKVAAWLLILGMLAPLPSISIHLTLALVCAVPILVMACAIRGFQEQVSGSGVVLLGFSAFILSVLGSVAAAAGLLSHQFDYGYLLDGGLVTMTLLIVYGVALRVGEQAVTVAVSDESVKAKSLFFATMSHEIRTPINGVLGMLQLLEREPLSGAPQRYVKNAKHSAQLLLGIVNDILDFSKVEAGKMDVELKQFNMASLLEQTVETFAILESNRHLEFVVDTAGLSHPLISSDPAKIIQILNNLISNAAKFTEQGEIEISAAISGSTSKPLLRLKVRDTGIGIAPDKLPGLFDTFTQADQSTTRKYGGTGLGLAIVKNYAELLGGSVSAHSKPGVGTTFEVCLVVTPAVEQPQRPQLDDTSIVVYHHNKSQRIVIAEQLRQWSANVVETTAAENCENLFATGDFDYAIYSSGKDVFFTAHKGALATEPFQIERPTTPGKLARALSDDHNLVAQSDSYVKEKHFKLLIAEDNQINTEVALGILADAGYANVVTVENGQQALELLRREAFDLVLMDCQMPVLDGYETTRQIRGGATGQQSEIPVIAMTANALPGDRERCLEAGMSDYLPKPIDPDKLEETLRRWL